jgi:hypothetical protein
MMEKPLIKLVRGMYGKNHLGFLLMNSMDPETLILSGIRVTKEADVPTKEELDEGYDKFFTGFVAELGKCADLFDDGLEQKYHTIVVDYGFLDLHDITPFFAMGKACGHAVELVAVVDDISGLIARLPDQSVEYLRPLMSDYTRLIGLELPDRWRQDKNEEKK